MGILIGIIIVLLLAGLAGGIEWVLLFFLPPDEAIDIATSITLIVFVGGIALMSFKMYND